jgi:preprotein translocase subunit SecG
MINTIRLILALIVLLLIAPQTQKSNIVLRVFHESGFFIDYGEAEWFLKTLTWLSIFSFLIISLI